MISFQHEKAFDVVVNNKYIFAKDIKWRRLASYHPVLFLFSQWGISWWRHQMETFFALLALCAGISPVTGELPSQRPVPRRFEVFFYPRLNKGWANTREASDWRRYRAHYDVIVMCRVFSHRPRACLTICRKRAMNTICAVIVHLEYGVWSRKNTIKNAEALPRNVLEIVLTRCCL